MRPPYHAYPFAALLAAAGLLTPASAHDGNQIVLGNGDGPDKTHLIDPHSRSRRGLRGKFLHITGMSMSALSAILTTTIPHWAAQTPPPR